MFLLIEFVLCILAVLIAFLFPDLGGKWFAGIERSLNRLAQRRGWAVLSVGVTALALRAALLPIEPVPQPQVFDEFSYLLMADTFAHGRLANPTHPMWVHFETYHVNQKPRYVSMYYPAQGVFLAIGQVFFGHPFWGVWLSVGIMCAAICWMLQAWLPPIWALVGGLLAAIRLGGFNYWANSYWGGAVAAIGGALVLGVILRIRKHCCVRDSLILGLGFVILANSRPYEGLFFSLPVIAVLIKWLFDKRTPASISLWRVVLPLCLIIVMGGAWMLYYFWRTTGNPLLSPYFVNIRSYNPVPYFPWQHIKPIPQYDHVEMKDFYLGWWLDQYSLARSHPFLAAILKIASLWMFFLGVLFSLPLLMATVILPHRATFGELGLRLRLLILVTLSTFIGLSFTVFLNVHYAAPLTGAIYFLMLLGMQWLRRWKCRGERIGLAIVRSTVTICVLLFVLRAVTLGLHFADPWGEPIWFSREPEAPWPRKGTQ